MSAAEDREALVEAMRVAYAEAMGRYAVEGTPVDPNSYGGPPYKVEGPWFLIDRLHAEPEVNWPGELVAEYSDWKAARDEQGRLWTRAALSAIPTAMGLDADTLSVGATIVSYPGPPAEVARLLRALAHAAEATDGR